MSMLAESGSLGAAWGPPPVRETVGSAAYRMLRDAILQGYIPPGARINEAELASTWRISRTPIRDALRRLEAEGLLQAVPGRGMVVPRRTIAEADDLYEIREVLESRAARRAAERSTPDLYMRLNGFLKAFGAALKQDDPDRMLGIDDEFHLAIAAAAGNRHLERAIRLAREQTHQMRTRMILARGRASKSFREMAKVAAAVRRRDGARAEAAMREHIASLKAELGSVLQDIPDERG